MNQKKFYSLKEVKIRCTEGRFFSYSDWFDKIFIPLSMYFVWLFVNLRISANIISWISAFFAIVAAILISCQNPIYIIIGSFFYLIYYLFDYIDGAVARFNRTSGVSGQYIDWIMHVISSSAIMSGIAIGAISSTGNWLIPFCILSVVSSILTYARYSMAWFAIIMDNQQRRSKGLDMDKITLETSIYKREYFLYDFIRKCVCKFYHEETLIFSLPILAFLHYFISYTYIDFRVLLVVGGGLFYFPVMVIEIQKLASSKKIPEASYKLFKSNEKPVLPDDHFFK